jgi:cytochrome c oxidase subunit III
VGSLARRTGGIHYGSGGVSPGGGGDGRAGRDAPSPRDRLLRARLGLGVALTPVLMMFLIFTVAFMARRLLGVGDTDPNSTVREWIHIPLPIPLLIVNSLILALSGVTMEMSRRTMARKVVLAPVLEIPGISLGKDRAVPWLPITAALGFAFLAGQGLGWRQLASSGYLLHGSRASAFFYLMTILHAIHLSGGLLALLYAVTMPWLNKALESRRLVVDIAAWYWHFMTALWLLMLPMLIAAS